MVNTLGSQSTRRTEFELLHLLLIHVYRKYSRYCRLWFNEALAKAQSNEWGKGKSFKDISFDEDNVRQAAACLFFKRHGQYCGNAKIANTR